MNDYMIWIYIVVIVSTSVWAAWYMKNGGKVHKGRDYKRAQAPATRLADVAGQAEAVAEAREVLDLLRNASKYDALGVEVPSGILLAGPPGCGKTLLARAVAGELDAAFFAVAGSDFTDTFVGRGARNIRSLFKAARKAAKKRGHAIVFIDEIDAVGRKRTGAATSDGGTQETENTLNALLVEMDGFAGRDGVYILGATNRPDLLDPALTRPGRFAKTVTVSLPDRNGRRDVLALYVAKRAAKGQLSVDPSFDVDVFASRLLGLSAAQIEEVVAEAARAAARQGLPAITQACFEDALGRVYLGPERRSFAFTPEERRLTAWHEAGHAICAFLEAHSENPQQVTIVPRGMAGGVTWRAPREAVYPTREQFQADLVVAMGGKAAEKVLLNGSFTTGPGSDCIKASEIALAMVAELGFSPLGSLRRTELMQVSDTVAREVAEAAQVVLDTAEDRAAYWCFTEGAFLRAVAEALEERETLHLADIEAIWSAARIAPLNG